MGIADGKLDITFTRGVDNPEINGIEIIPADARRGWDGWRYRFAAE